MTRGPDLINHVKAIVDAVGNELASTPFAIQTQHCPLENIPATTEEEVAARSSRASDWEAALLKIDLSVLPVELALDAQVALITAQRWKREGDWYWVVHDPLQLGFYGLFGPTAYCGGWYLNVLNQLLVRASLETVASRELYCDLVGQLAAVVATMQVRLEGQRARGIVMPGPQIPRSLALIDATAKSLSQSLLPNYDRLRKAPNGRQFRERVRALIEDELQPSLNSLSGFVADLATVAPANGGLCNYPGGAAIYDELVAHHTTLDHTPRQLHEIGHQRLLSIRETMSTIRADVGFSGDDKEFAAACSNAPGWRATNVAEVSDAFERTIARVRPYLDQWLRFQPRSPFGVEPLPDALGGSMTFGYYQVPANAQSMGRYFFNAPNLIASGLTQVAALTFHELVPGHHVHLASQAENASLAKVRKFNSFNSFNEGWAEYAATLAGENGLYESPEDQFGRLMLDSFLTCRLVVDTGLNAMGWDLEQAVTFLRDEGFISEREAVSEALRYSSDVPGQSLAYKVGDTFLVAQRERMRSALGSGFDIRDFHDTVLAPGALPLPLVARQVDRSIERLTADQPS